MNETQSSIRVVITLYLALAFFSIPHLIDDFLFDIPAEFGISVHIDSIFSRGIHPDLSGHPDPSGQGPKKGE